MSLQTHELTEREQTTIQAEAYWDALSEPGNYLHDDYYRFVRSSRFVPQNLNDEYSAVLLSDETNHPGSNSFKARNGALSVAVIRRERPDVHTIDIASHGNAGMGFVRPALESGLNIVMHADNQLEPVRRKELERMGAQVRQVASDRFEDATQSAADAGNLPGHVTGEAFRTVLPKAAHGMWAVETVRNLLRMEREGKTDLSKGVDLRLAVAGGGFVSGSAMAIKYLEGRGEIAEGQVRVHGVQAAGCDAASQLRRQALYGEPLRRNFVPDNRIASCAVRATCDIAQAIINDPRYVSSIDVVNLEQLAAAIRRATRRTGHMVEPAGALSLASAMEYIRTEQSSERRLQVAVVCGMAATQAQFQEFMDMLPDTQTESLDRINKLAREQTYLLDTTMPGTTKRRSHRTARAKKRDNNTAEPVLSPRATSVWASPTAGLR